MGYEVKEGSFEHRSVIGRGVSFTGPCIYHSQTRNETKTGLFTDWNLNSQYEHEENEGVVRNEFYFPNGDTKTTFQDSNL